VSVEPYLFPSPLLIFRSNAMLHDGVAPRILGLKYRKGLALLGFLAAHADRVVRRETLAGLMWPDLEAAAGRANLRVVLADLAAMLRREGLAEILDVQRDWLALRPNGRVTTDLRVLEAVRPGDVPGDPHVRMLQLLGALEGTWLDGAEEATSEEFCEWLSARRAHFSDSLARVQGRLALEGEAELAMASHHNRLPAADAAADAESAGRAPELASLTLLRVELADVPASEHVPSVAMLPAILSDLAAMASSFGGHLLDLDDVGCTFCFGMGSRHTGQRWQALRCIAGLVRGSPVLQTLRMGVTSGSVLLARQPVLRVVGWRARLVERLAQRAEPGEVVFDDSFADLATYFGCENVGIQRFRGLQREFVLYRRQLADISDLQLPPGGDFSGSFFGRQAFLEPLLAAMAAIPPAVGGAWCITGEPGAGKTRTAWECARQLQAKGHAVFWVGALPESADIPWRGLHELLMTVLSGAGAIERRLEQMLARLTVPMPDEGRHVLLSFARTHRVAQGQRGPLAQAMAALLYGNGQQPALLVVDDVQWLDAATAELLLHMAGPPCPLRWLLTCRSGAAQPLLIPALQTLELAPLDDHTAQQILLSLPDGPTLSAEARRGRIANARGLPLYLLADSLPSDRASHFVEFCRALLNRLGDSREAMEAAAVLGMLFSLDDLAVLCGIAQARQSHERASAAGLIVDRGAGRAAFFHARLREYLLSATPIEVLQRHARTAAVLRTSQGLHASAAGLWEQAGDRAAATSAWFNAAQSAFAEDDICAACDNCSHMARLGYFPGHAGVRARIFHARCLIARHGYGSTPAYTIAMELMALQLPQALDAGTVFDVQVLTYLGSSSQEYLDGLNHATRLVALATTPTQQATSSWAMGNTLFWLGRFAEARTWLESHLRSAQALDAEDRRAHLPSDLAVFARSELAWLLWLVGEPQASRDAMAQALAGAEASATRQDLCIALCFQGFIAWCAGDHALLAQVADRAHAVADAEGLQFWRAVAQLLVALARAHQGQPVDFDALTAGVEGLLLGYRAASTTGAWFVADALLACGQHAEALALLEQTLAVSNLTEHQYCCMDLWRLKALAHAALGQAAQAEAARERARDEGLRAGVAGWSAHWRHQLQGRLAAVG